MHLIHENLSWSKFYQHKRQDVLVEIEYSRDSALVSAAGTEYPPNMAQQNGK